MSIPKLSEAIRLGSTLMPRSYSYLTKNDDGSYKCGCDIGRALVAAGAASEAKEAAGSASSLWPVYNERITKQNMPRWANSDYLTNWLIHETQWPVQQAINIAVLRNVPTDVVADWVETIEQRLEAQATPQLEVEHVTN